jgi:hypothetical protein
VLYLRSRQVAIGVAGALACVLGIGLLADGSDVTRTLFAVFAVLAVTAVTASGLAGPDAALERTAALDWGWRRAVHVVAVAGLGVLLGVLAGPPAATEVVVRAAVGLSGLAALGVTLFGGGLAWCLPIAWTTVAVIAMMAGYPPAAPLVTWLVQPPGTTAATVAAVVLGLVGLGVYTAKGPRAQ